MRDSDVTIGRPDEESEHTSVTYGLRLLRAATLESTSRRRGAGVALMFPERLETVPRSTRELCH